MEDTQESKDQALDIHTRKGGSRPKKEAQNMTQAILPALAEFTLPLPVRHKQFSVTLTLAFWDADPVRFEASTQESCRNHKEF